MLGAINLNRWYENKVLIILFFSIIAFIFTLPIFHHFDNWGIQDWDRDFFKHAVPRLTILRYHQIPLWNPYYCGGSPMLAHPESRFLSPTFLLILFFGVVKGIKLSIWLHLVIGLVGMYQLSRHYKLDRIVALLPPFVYMLSSMYALFLTGGMTALLPMVYLPWIFLFYLKSFPNLKFVFLTGLFLALMFFAGGIYPFVISLSFIVFYSFLAIGTYRMVKPMKVLSITLIFTLCLVAIKLFPSIELTQKYPRHPTEYEGFSLNSLRHSLLDRDQSLASIEKYEHGDYLHGFFDKKGFIDGMSWFMDENGMYIGPIPLLLFLIGIGFYGKRRWRLATCFLIFLWVSFGDRAPISLWKLLHALPVYNSMRVAQRFRIVFMMCLAMFAGFGFQTMKNCISQKVTKKVLARLIILAIPLVILTDLIIVNSRVFNDAFPIPPLQIKRNPEFFQIWQLPFYDKNGMVTSNVDPYSSGSSLYPAFLANVGSINEYEQLPVPRNAIPKGSKHYRGEVFLEGGQGEVHIGYWSPNKFVINFNVLQEVYIIVNQNYYSGWRVKGDRRHKVESINGLLAVKISPYEKAIEMYYLPTSFIIGLIVTSLTLLLSIIISTQLYTIKRTKVS